MYLKILANGGEITNSNPSLFLEFIQTFKKCQDAMIYFPVAQYLSQNNQ